jgi:hypothetical protein
MKRFIVTAFVVALAASAASAQDQARAFFVPVAETSDATQPNVRRAKPVPANFAEADLSQAELRQVDKNGDGKVSFDELLAFDF